MIENFGVGIDIVDVNKFRNMPYEEETSFYNDIFDKNEINYCLKFSDPYPHFAGKFAIKEAVIKSVNRKLTIKDIFTDHVDGKPIAGFRQDKAEKILLKISLSHEKNIAVAVTISEMIT